MRTTHQFRCTLNEEFKKKKEKKLKKFIIQTQLSLASVLFRLCKECRKEPVNIFLKEKKIVPDLTLTFLQLLGEQEQSASFS